jgi:hypothetical protein
VAGSAFHTAVESLTKSPHTIQQHSFELLQFWPEVPDAEAPAHVPENVSRAFMQAESNFVVDGNEEAAGAMYRRALERALSTKYPDVKGTLYKKVDALVAAHVLTKELGDWSHQIRLIGNEAVHEDFAVDRHDLIAMRGFCEAVLRYLFTLPGEVELLRARANKNADD